MKGDQIGRFTLGGLLFGAWLYFLLFASIDEELPRGAWGLWGIVGILIGAGMYLARAASEAVRIGAFIAIGITIAMLGLGGMEREDPTIFAAIITAAGAIIVASGLPALGAPQAPEE